MASPSSDFMLAAHGRGRAEGPVDQCQNDVSSLGTIPGPASADTLAVPLLWQFVHRGRHGQALGRPTIYLGRPQSTGVAVSRESRKRAIERARAAERRRTRRRQFLVGAAALLVAGGIAGAIVATTGGGAAA